MSGRGGRRGVRPGKWPTGEIDEEVRFHIEGRAEELAAQGVPRDEAWQRAVAAFGDVDNVRAELASIDARGARVSSRAEWLAGWLRDVRFGARRLRGSPGYTVVAILTLALGVGASVATFSVLNGVALRPFPYAQPDRLVEVWPAQNMNVTISRAFATVPSLASSTGLSFWGMTLTGQGDAVQLRGAVVDVGYFEVFAVRPALGREFRADDLIAGATDVVLLSDRLWRERFGSDPAVVGRRIDLGGYIYETREVIGVMPPDHRPLADQVEVWLPFEIGPGVTVANDSTWYVNEQFARLAPGATVASADAEVRALATQLHEDHPTLYTDEELRTASVVGLIDGVIGDVDRTLWMLLAAVGLVLLIACGNLSNLLLARGVAERRQLAVRAALGASRWRLVRQQIVESTLVAIAGGVLGIAIARIAMSALRFASTSGLPRSAEIRIDGAVLAFAFGICCASILLFALLPALRATRHGARLEDEAGARGGSAPRAAHRLNRVLLGAEIALAMVLTTGAALMLSSFARLRAVEPGMDTSDVLVVELAPAPPTEESEQISLLYTQVIDRVSALPGVTGAGFIHLLPFTDNNWSFPYLAEGHVPDPNVGLPSANFRVVTPGYFDAVDVPLLRGRDVDRSDRAGTVPVMLLNQRLADELWPGEDPVGKEVGIFGNRMTRVIGVVGDVRQHALDQEPAPEMYVPFAQWGRVAAANLMVEGTGAFRHASQIREIVRELDPAVPVPEIQLLDDALGASLARRRFFAGVLIAFGLVALALGGSGVYGVMSHVVGSRQRDFGLRMALGAPSRDILRHALASGLVPASLGLLAGTLGAFATGRLLATLLYDIPPVHVPTYALVAGTLSLVALVAAWAPARRAARSDPLSVMRME